MKWSDFSNEFIKSNEFVSMVEPTLSIKEGDKIFTIGSCFARNIEEILSHKFEFPILSYAGKDGEYVARRNRGILNKFTPNAILNELRWFKDALLDFEGATSTYFKYPLQDGTIIDLGLRQLRPVSEERFIERRQEIFNLFAGLKDVNAIIITFGNLEQVSLDDGRLIEHIPTNRFMLKNNKFSISIESDRDLLNCIEEIYAILQSINPDLKIIFTVSPITMERTFGQKHIIHSNLMNKMKLLRAVVAMAEAYENISYFPSYEMVTFLGINALENDLRHIRGPVVEKVSRGFEKFVSL